MLYELLLGITPFYTNNINKLYKSIQNDKLQVPGILSKEAQDLLQRLLHKNPKNRIKIPQIKAHPFFRDIDWEQLAARKIEPPLKLSMNDYSEGDEGQMMMMAEQKYARDQAQKFSDKDYADSNQTLNRVKQFTFVRESRE